MACVMLSGREADGKGKKLHTEWKWVFGEIAWDIQVANFTGGSCSLCDIAVTQSM